MDTQSQESVPSAPATGTAPATGLAPAAVTGLRGAVNSSDIEIDIELLWQRNTEEDVDHYDIYRGVLVDGVWQYEKWGEVGQTWEDEPTLSYVHELYEPQGETSRWAVVAVDYAGNSRFTTGEDFSFVTVTEPVVWPFVTERSGPPMTPLQPRFGPVISSPITKPLAGPSGMVTSVP
ncbi:hypothetical protein [Streptomyces sp. NPDC002671]